MFPINTRFLIIDDNLSMRIVLVNALRKLGYNQFLEASDGASALAMLSAGAGVDLILCDHYMPFMSGMELLSRLNSDSKLKHLPFMFVTVDTEKKLILRALELGAVGFIIKPFIPEHFERKLNDTYRRIQQLKG